MFRKVGENIYEYGGGGGGCVFGVPLIGWAIIRIFHINIFRLHFTGPAIWIDYALLFLGIAAFFFRGRSLLRIDRNKRIVTVYTGSKNNPDVEQIPFDSIEKVDASGNQTSKRRRHQEAHTSPRAQIFLKLKDGRRIVFKTDAISYESAVRNGWDIEKLIGIYGKEPDEDGVTGSEETEKFLKLLDGMYKFGRFFNFRNRG